MPNLSDKELKIHEWIGACAAGTGLIVALVTKIPHDPYGFWAGYISVLHGAGWMAFGLGLILLCLAAASRRTQFFDLNAGITADKFAISMTAIVIGVIILLCLALPRLPATPPERLPRDPKVRVNVVRMETNFKMLVSAAIMLAGASVAGIPCVRFFKK